MPRNISFSLTTQQFRDRSKTVTRRMGWERLKAEETLCGCEKCMGLRPGQRIVKLGLILVVDARRERLERMIDEIDYGMAETELEGFPNLTPEEFVTMFCTSHKGCRPQSLVTRIEFKYLD